MSQVTRESVLNGMKASADRMGLDLEDLQEMIQEVLDDCSAKSKRLKEAIQIKDFESVKKIAHDIKGSTANYGLQSASDIAMEIEKNNEMVSLDMVDDLLQQFEAFSKLELDKPE